MERRRRRIEWPPIEGKCKWFEYWSIYRYIPSSATPGKTAIMEQSSKMSSTFRTVVTIAASSSVLGSWHLLVIGQCPLLKSCHEDLRSMGGNL